MVMARVSVVVPTYNRRESVIEAIDSIRDQTFRDYEIVIADDGSTDGTPLALFEHLGAQPEAIGVLSRMSPNSVKPFSHAFLHEDRTIQYHYGINRGLSTARNRGIRSSRGEYVAFIESEDLWDEAHLKTTIDFLDEQNDTKVCRVGERYMRDGKPRTRRHTCTNSGWIFDVALEASPMSTSAVVLHRSCFRACGSFDENLPACDEYDLWIRIASRYPIQFLKGPVVTRRSGRPDGSSRAWSWERFRVYALEKAFQGGSLAPEQRFLVAQEIVQKCERLVDGFRRQKSEERSNFYERKRRRFAQEVRKLRCSTVAV